MIADTEDLFSDGLTTVAQAAKFLSLSKRAIYNLMETGQLPYTHIGRARRIPRRSLIDLARGNLQGAVAS